MSQNYNRPTTQYNTCTYSARALNHWGRICGAGSR